MSWSRIGVRTIAVAVAALLPATVAASGRRPADARPAELRVIVREAAPASHEAERLVAAAGGAVTKPLPVVDGFAATVPRAAAAPLARSAAVAGLWPDAPLRLLDDDEDGDAGDADDDADDEDEDDGAGDEDVPLDEYDELPPDDAWRAAIRLDALREAEGEDVGVAIVDTGVAYARDLEDALEARVDLTPGRDGIDRFGHGTHIAGIVAGDGGRAGRRRAGVAPDVELVTVKVAGPDGATDVSMVLGALQWVASHRARYGIRVVNLSLGLDASQPALVDPLNHAVQRLWDAGIVVVAAAGNGGPDGAVAKPGDDPLVITVGAADIRGTGTRADDVVADFSARGPGGDGGPKPDLVAPGVSIVSVRAPDSAADRLRPSARVGSAYFKGTGTSQATAIVTGVVALVLEASPRLTPDEVKALLVSTADRTLARQPGGGAGLVDAAAAVAAARDPEAVARLQPQTAARSTGLGSLDRSRGSQRVHADPDGDGIPEEASGERDVLGRRWDPAAWAAQPWLPQTWGASAWAPHTTRAEEWERVRSAPPTWGGVVWDSKAWSSKAWSDSGWVSKAWSSKAWSTWN